MDLFMYTYLQRMTFKQRGCVGTLRRRGARCSCDLAASVDDGGESELCFHQAFSSLASRFRFCVVRQPISGVLCRRTVGCL